MNESVNQRFNAIINELSNSVTDFSKKIGIAQTTLYNQLNGAKGVSLDTVIATLDTFPNVSSEWLLFGRGHMLIPDNAAPITGNETPDHLSLIAENARLIAQIEEKNRQILILEDRCKWLKDCYDDALRNSTPEEAKKHAS